MLNLRPLLALWANARICWITALDIKDLHLFMVSYAASEFVLSGIQILILNGCLVIFGDIIGESIYSYYWPFFLLSNFIQYAIGLLMIDFCCINRIFYVFLAFNLLCLALVVWARFQGRWENNLNHIVWPWRKRPE